MKQESAVTLGRAEAERWVMDRSCSGRGAASESRAALDVIRVSARQIEQRRIREPESIKGAEWLLDNLHLVQEIGRDTVQSFRGGRNLPGLIAPERTLRVLRLARSALRDVKNVEKNDLIEYVTGVQEICTLTESELSLFLPALYLEILRQLEDASRTLCKKDSTVPGIAERMECIFTAFHALNGMDFSEELERLNKVDGVLRRDPAGVYPGMDGESRRQYRRQVRRRAKKENCSEVSAAEQAITAALEQKTDVGSVLYALERTSRGAWYIAMILLPALLLALYLSFWMDHWWGGLLLFLPLTEIAKSLIDYLAMKCRHPRYVLRLELKEGIPPEGRTLCVIVSLLTGPESGAELAAKLERYYLANRGAGQELRFGILADLPDSARPMDSTQKDWVRRAKEAVGQLNRRYPAHFALFFRTPQYQPREERYLGWERKRGALLELARFLRSVPSGLQLLEGERSALTGVRYLLTLDSDTVLNRDAARRMVGAMLHPLNRSKVDPVRRVVTAGYGILQPRTAVSLDDSGRTPFARVMAGQGGLDPYGCASSDVYHDLFDRGTFTGKGILDVEAFHLCMEGRFPEGRVLSHDLLEGGYLRAGLISDVEMTDGFPVRCSSFYRRLHRWVRGDWQTAPWLLRRVRTASGEREQNPLTTLDRWKILDNLRRSLMSATLLVSLILGICLSGRIFAAFGTVALLALLISLFLTGADLLFRQMRGGRRFHSFLVTGFTGALVRTLVHLLLMPVQAWFCLSGALTALWRMLITKRKLLEWVTAAQSDKQTGIDWNLILPGPVAGCLVGLLAKTPAGVLAGLFWLLSPLCIHWLSQPTERSASVGKRDQAFLLHEASLIWRYFEDHLDETHHYLPPDNVQEQPIPDVAERTSPTNIGMTLLSCLTALDLGLAEERRVTALLTHILETLEGLPKWRGHLYNWYDTRAAEPIAPVYVSTVDSGNLCGCLLTLWGGLQEKGYSELSERARALADAMTFAPLFDRERNLFYIGYDCAARRYSDGRYDLLASEARLASYIAAARGEVSPRHWARLSRAMVGRRRYCGMISWSGTMFEYFMPQLLLPTPKDSMLYETLCFCVCNQMEWAEELGIPWGCSESAFYALDEGDHYRYKAHGVPALGIKRELKRDAVIAPYASYLTLGMVPRAAVRNLKRLRDLGAEGRYGLYEAVDFTPERSEGRKNGMPVRNWMSHHLGMSLAAIDNALCGQKLVRRFLCDPAMAAGRELLEEKIPMGAPVLKYQKTGQRRWEQGMKTKWEVHGSGSDESRPACHLLSNGRYSVFLTSDGGGWSQCDGIRLTEDRSGIAVMVHGGDRIDPVFPAGTCSSQLRWRFQGDRASVQYKGPFFQVEETICVSAGHAGELRRFRFQFDERLEGQEIEIYFRPVLTRQSSYLAHPAFSSLSVMTFGIPNGVVFRKLDEPDRVLTVRWSAKGARWTTNRFHVANGTVQTGGPTEGIVLDPCLLLRVPAEHSQVEFRVALVYESLEESKRAAQSVIAGGFGGACDLFGRLTELARRETPLPLQLSGLWSRLLIPEPSPFSAETRGQETLWPFGISGDDPIVAAVVREEAMDWCVWLALQHSVSARLGYTYDLVYLLPAEGGRAVEEQLRRILTRLRMAEEIGAHGGIYLVRRDRSGSDAILANAELVLHGNENWSEPDCPKEIPVQPFHIPQAVCSPEWQWAGTGFRIFTHGGLLPIRWSHVLANESFGWLADEAGTGHLWYQNAHENRLTPWQNDPLADSGPESLMLLNGTEEVSLFAARDGLETEVCYDMGFAVWRKQLRGIETELTAFVPPGCPARVFLLKFDGGGELRLRWTLTGRLSDRESHGRFVQKMVEENCLLLRNPVNTHFPGQTMLLTASAPCVISGENPFELICTVRGRAVLVAGVFHTGEEHARLTALLENGAAERALEKTKAWWLKRVTPLEIQTPEPVLDRYMNSWALYQLIASRLFGRTGLYQCGGGYGFRDQLQDICALIPTEPKLARLQILRCCAHQFEEGDVQHWWHPDGTGLPERGVRTRISDDLLWLPYAVSLWVTHYGADDLLEEKIPYLRSRILTDQERERYERPERSNRTASVYDHCLRAIECVLERGVGEHGLCRMGTGDWNDGMNRIGARGRGESVWLTWFLSKVLADWAEVARAAGRNQDEKRFRPLTWHFARQANCAWDGAWYLRGYNDDGQPFGSRGSAECAIDSVAQSFSVFAPRVDTHRCGRAVDAALEHLWDKASGTVALLSPPFGGLTDPGYIRNYPPGVRENGGQYTHGAIWLARACFQLGRSQEGYELLRDLLPGTHEARRYLAEPYVLAGDVSLAEGQLGRGGWSWYTGAAGWYYRTIREELLGLRFQDGLLTIQPKLPDNWPECRVVWRLPKVTLEITMTRGPLSGILLDDVPATGEIDCRQLDGWHCIQVTLPETEAN